MLRGQERSGSHCRCRPCRRSANGTPAAPCAGRRCGRRDFARRCRRAARGGCGTAGRRASLRLRPSHRSRRPSRRADRRHAPDRTAPRSSPPRAPRRSRCAAASTAAPPRLWPIRIAGAADRPPQMIGRGDQIVDIRGECGVGEFALAGAEPGEIEAQHRDAVQLEPLGDMPRRPIALAAGEAMREQRHRADRRHPADRAARRAFDPAHWENRTVRPASNPPEVLRIRASPRSKLTAPAPASPHPVPRS